LKVIEPVSAPWSQSGNIARGYLAPNPLAIIRLICIPHLQSQHATLVGQRTDNHSRPKGEWKLQAISHLVQQVFGIGGNVDLAVSNGQRDVGINAIDRIDERGVDVVARQTNCD
jgi:hypothetical protein